MTEAAVYRKLRIARPNVPLFSLNEPHPMFLEFLSPAG